MRPEFEDVVINDNDELRSYLDDFNLLLTLVHERIGFAEFENAIPDSFEDERFVRVDLRECNESGRRFWTAITPFQAEAYGFPGHSELPVPYLNAYMPGVGNYSSAYDLNGVASLLERARKEKINVLKMREIFSHNDQTGKSEDQTAESSS